MLKFTIFTPEKVYQAEQIGDSLEIARRKDLPLSSEGKITGVLVEIEILKGVEADFDGKIFRLIDENGKTTMEIKEVERVVGMRAIMEDIKSIKGSRVSFV